MTLDKARELISVQLQFGGGYNRNAVRLILAEIANEHGQAAVDQLIRELDLSERFGLQQGTDFSRGELAVHPVHGGHHALLPSGFFCIRKMAVQSRADVDAFADVQQRAVFTEEAIDTRAARRRIQRCAAAGEYCFVTINAHGGMLC